MDVYRENILDHYRNPRNFGELKNSDATHEENNPFCGDRIRMDIRISMVNGQKSMVEEIRFSGEGCAISLASASMLTEAVKDKPLNDLHKLDKDAILEMLGIQLSPTRLKCALLPLEVLHKTIAKVNSKR